MGAPGGKVNILGGHNISHSKQKIVYVLVSWTVSKLELFHCTVVWTYMKMHSDEQHAMSSHELRSALMLVLY
jgi:hypothetical protein